MTVVELVEQSKMIQRENYYITFYPCVNKRRAIHPADYDKWYNEEYRRLHKEETAEYNKEYRERRQSILSTKFNCECGGKYTHEHKASHLKSIRHQAFRKM
jgi:hypothetical protein